MEKAEQEIFRPGSAGDLRAWFEKNGSVSPGAWIEISRKNSDRPGVSYEEAVEEALSFGWIDGRLRPVDDERYRLWFAPRKPGGTWAKSNRERVTRLIEQGRMTPAGLAAVEAARRDGSWDMLQGVDRLEKPPDLQSALLGKGNASSTFESWTESYRKRVLYWIRTARREETRASRIARTVEAASEGKKPFE